MRTMHFTTRIQFIASIPYNQPALVDCQNYFATCDVSVLTEKKMHFHNAIVMVTDTIMNPQIDLCNPIFMS